MIKKLAQKVYLGYMKACMAIIMAILKRLYYRGKQQSTTIFLPHLEVICGGKSVLETFNLFFIEQLPIILRSPELDEVFVFVHGEENGLYAIGNSVYTEAEMVEVVKSLYEIDRLEGEFFLITCHGNKHFSFEYDGAVFVIPDQISGNGISAMYYDAEKDECVITQDSMLRQCIMAIAAVERGVLYKQL